MSNRKAIVLAAGRGAATRQLLLQPLGDSTVIEHSLGNVTAVVPKQDVVIVVAAGDTEVRDLLGPGWHYVEQTEQAGTGDAVLAARQAIDGFEGGVLIAYADTPMLRVSSLRGLLWRHELTGAQFSMLTALVPDPGAMGRIVRDNGRITGIVEASDASEEQRPIDEVNVGAYVVDGAVIFDQLAELASRGEHRLTELAQWVIRGGGHVSSYAILDPDEVQGINTTDELQKASDIVLKRLFAPAHTIETGEIAFGTGGWRALIGEAFTIHNVRRLCQAIANEVVRRGEEAKGVVVGADRRFLSTEAKRAAAEVFAGNNIHTRVLVDDVPTPLVTFAAPHLNCTFGLIVTASHNPALWNGIKVFRADGSLPLNDETNRLQAEANSFTPADVVALDYDLAMKSNLLDEVDLTNDYVDYVERFVDVKAMRKLKRSGGRRLRVVVDPMYGTSQQTLGMILSDGRVRADFIHSEHNPLFGGRAPRPDPEMLSEMADMIRLGRGKYDIGLANDADSDRIGIVDETGRYVPSNELLVVLYRYLHEARGLKGGVVRNLSTTHMLDRLADHFGEPHLEVPVGFRSVAVGMDQIDALMGGESSGGLTIRGYMKGKDGIFACALVCEMLAHTSKSLSCLVAEAIAITGRLEQCEIAVPATPEMRIELPRRISAAAPTQIDGVPVTSISNLDGIKCLLDDGSWVLLRFSGTEPTLRMVAEAPTVDQANRLLDWVRQFSEE